MTIRRELMRKGVHTLLALLFASIPLLLETWYVLVASFLLFLLFLFMRVGGFRTVFHGVARLSYGELFFIGGVVASYMLSFGRTDVFQMGMIVLAVADPTAALIGMRFGKHTYTVFGERRSFEGSFACFLSCVAIAILFGTTYTQALTIGMVLTVAETLSIKGSDNLVLPMVSGLLFTIFT